MKCLAATQGPKVRVNAVLPGLLLTEWVSKGTQDNIPTDTLLTSGKGQKFPPDKVQIVKDKSLLKKEVCVPIPFDETRIDLG